MLLYIIRHGVPDYATDTLTETGRAQAEAVVLRFQRLGLDRIFSSPMGRARETAEPTARALGLPVEICPFMSERVAGSHFYYEGEDGKHHWAFFRRELVLGDPVLLRSQDSFSHGFYADDALARQGFAELAAASDDFLAALGYRKEGDANAYRVTHENDLRVAAFCHGGFGLHWLSYLLAIPPHLLTCTFDFTHTGVTVLRFRDEGKGLAYPRLWQFADLSHIMAAGLPYRYDDAVEI